MRLYEAMEEPKDPIYYSAPVILFVIGPADNPNPISCGLACENIMLAAYSLGIGSCWVGFGSMTEERQQPGTGTLEDTRAEEKRPKSPTR
jgi:nitroreductase